MALQQFNRIKQANDIILEVAVECGLPKITDPFSSADPQYQRLITLLNLSGNSLLDTYQWARLINRFDYDGTGFAVLTLNEVGHLPSYPQSLDELPA